jgi:hypothetical protein
MGAESPYRRVPSDWGDATLIEQCPSGREPHEGSQAKAGRTGCSGHSMTAGEMRERTPIKRCKRSYLHFEPDSRRVGRVSI